jgi:ketosteroid isomerase-like protein
MIKPVILASALLIALCASGTTLVVYAQAAPPAAGDDKAAIEALEQSYNDAFNAKSVNAIMACYAPGKGLFVFDAIPPREYPSWDAYKRDWEGLFAANPGPASNAISEQSITVVGAVAYGHNIQTAHFTAKDGSQTTAVVRVTDVYRKINGKWLIVQEHVSFPVDMATGKADMMSKR